MTDDGQCLRCGDWLDEHFHPEITGDDPLDRDAEPCDCCAGRAQ